MKKSEMAEIIQEELEYVIEEHGATAFHQGNLPGISKQILSRIEGEGMLPPINTKPEWEKE